MPEPCKHERVSKAKTEAGKPFWVCNSCFRRFRPDPPDYIQIPTGLNVDWGKAPDESWAEEQPAPPKPEPGAEYLFVDFAKPAQLRVRARVTASESAPKPEPRCGDCRFFAARSAPYGDCGRYPTIVNKVRDGWCGEYAPREAKP